MRKILKKIRISAIRKRRVTKRVFYGIDPGATGAFAAIDEDGSPVEVFGFKNMSESDMFEKINYWMTVPDMRYLEPSLCVLEKVHAFPNQGVSSSFKFGQSYGFARAAIVSSGVEWKTVTPRKWQESLGCMSGSGKKKKDKGIPLARARELFPDVEMNKTGYHAVYDGLLLAEYGRREALGLSFSN